jgi:hypothetical protein
LGNIEEDKIDNAICRESSNLDSLAFGLEAGLAGLGGPREVSDRNDEEGVAVERKY